MRKETSDGRVFFYLAITDTVISLLVFLQQTLVSKASYNKSNNGKSLNSWINKITSNQQNKMKGFEPHCLEGIWSCKRQMHGKYIKWELKKGRKMDRLFQGNYRKGIWFSSEKVMWTTSVSGEVRRFRGLKNLYRKSSVSSFVRRSWKCWKTRARRVMSSATRLSCPTPRLRKDRSWNETLWLNMTKCCTLAWHLASSTSYQTRRHWMMLLVYISKAKRERERRWISDVNTSWGIQTFQIMSVNSVSKWNLGSCVWQFSVETNNPDNSHTDWPVMGWCTKCEGFELFSQKQTVQKCAPFSPFLQLTALRYFL